jgi:hypothetical protein
MHTFKYEAKEQFIPLASIVKQFTLRLPPILHKNKKHNTQKKATTTT